MPHPAPASLDGLVNFRDLGGIPAAHGAVRSHILYRSESVSDLTESGRQELESSGIGTVIDLRSTAESSRAPGVAADSAAPRLVALPMLDGAVPTSFDEVPTLDVIYQALVRAHGEEFAKIAMIVAENEDAVLIHCTAGKDRTGLAVALLLLAVGADRERVRADYLSSAERLSGAWAERIFAMARVHGVEFPDTAEVRELVHGTSATAFDAAIAWVESEHGSAEGYLRAHGLTDEQAARLRERLVGR